MSMPTALATSLSPKTSSAKSAVCSSSATAEQRQWLSGYVAGFQAATEAPAAPAAPPAAKAKLTILYATESGNAEALAGAARKSAARLGFAAKAVDMMDTTPAEHCPGGKPAGDRQHLGRGRSAATRRSLHVRADGDERAAPCRVALRRAGAGRPRLCEVLRDRQADRRAARGVGRHAHCPARRLRPGFPEARRRLDRRHAARDRAGAGTGRRGDPCRFRPPRRRRRIVRARSTPRSPRRSTSTAAAPTSRRTMSSCRWPAPASPMSRAIRSVLCPRNDPALVEDVLRLAGQDGDAALHTALTERFDITTLTRAQIADYAALTGDATLRGLAEDAGARGGIPARSAVRRSAAGGAAQADGGAIDPAAAAVAAAALFGGIQPRRGRRGSASADRCGALGKPWPRAQRRRLDRRGGAPRRGHDAADVPEAESAFPPAGRSGGARSS